MYNHKQTYKHKSPCTDMHMYYSHVYSRDKIAFRTDLKLILNMDSNIDKENIKGETNS